MLPGFAVFASVLALFGAGGSHALGQTEGAFQVLVYSAGNSITVPTKDSPPAFLCASINDRPDISEGLTKVCLDFKHAAVPVELHLYNDGGHGFGYRKDNHSPVYGWLDRFNEWLLNLKPTIASH